MKKFTLTILMALGLWMLVPASSYAGPHIGIFVGGPPEVYYPPTVYYGGPYYGGGYYPRYYYGRHYYGHYGHYGRHWR